jgi:hypothetical protein
MAEEMRVIVKNGMMRYVYSDNLASLTKQGNSTTKRVSHVEPCDGGWQADLSPVDGPTLGPFSLRIDALKAEIEWLRENNIPVPK